MHYDTTAVVPLDFTMRLNALKEEVNTSVFEEAAVSPNELIAEIDRVLKITEDVNEKVAKVNEDYLATLSKGDSDTAQKLYEDSRALNSGLLGI